MRDALELCIWLPGINPNVILTGFTLFESGYLSSKLCAWGTPPRDHAAPSKVVLVSADTTMLHSTITTGSYILEKYSRSYPSNVSAQSQSQDLTAAQPEWQHFANPVISLTLDVKKSMDNKFESVRLRILWDMGMGHDGTPREITMVRTKWLHICAFELESVFRKTSISCRSLVSILEFTLHKVHLSKLSIEVR